MDSKCSEAYRLNAFAQALSQLRSCSKAYFFYHNEAKISSIKIIVLILYVCQITGRLSLTE